MADADQETLEEMFGLDTAPTALAKPTPKADAQEALRSLETRLFERAMVVTESIMQAADVDVQDIEASRARFVEEWGEEEGNRRFRVALAAWQNSKEAPAFLKLATQVTAASAKARAVAPQQQVLNISFVQMNGPTQILESVVVDE